MTEAVASQWPPPNGVTTQAVAREKAVITFTESVRINAPAYLVLEILRDVQNWDKWNSWVPRVTINKQIPSQSSSGLLHTGTAMTFHAVMDSSKPDSVSDAPQIVSDISTPESPSHYVSRETLDQDSTYTSDLSKVYRISWRGQGSLDWWGLREERFQEIIELGVKECELRSWEAMTGIVARVIKWKYGVTIREKTEGWCADLKRYAEERAAHIDDVKLSSPQA